MIRKNLYLLFLLASIISNAQVNLYSEVSTKETSVNNPVIFTVVLQVIGEDQIQESPIKLPDFSKFNYQYASEQNTYIDPVRKIRINEMVYQFSLDPKQAGNIKIGSALVKVNGKMYKSEPIDITVKDAEKKAVAVNNPAKNMYLNMQVDDREVYKDEPVVAILRAYSKNISNFRNLEPAKMRFSKTVSVRSIANFDESIEENSETDFSSQVIAMFVVIPKTTGYMDIPACEVSLSNHKSELVSNKVKINVKKLPEGAPENFKNAVGKYDVKVELIDKNKEDFEINKAFNVAVKISGSGNLTPSLLPKILSSADFETFEPKIVNNSRTTTEGIEGEIEAQYVIIPKVKGDIKIYTEDFSYFDPKEEKYTDLGKKFLVLTAVNSKDIAGAKSTLQKVNEYTNTVLDKVDSPVISTKRLKIKEHKQISWKAIFINLSLIALVSLFFVFVNKRFREKKKHKEQIKTIEKQPISNISEIETAIRNEATFDSKSQLDYLKIVMDTRSSSEFFTALDTVFAEADQYCNDHFATDFADYLKNNRGLTYYEKYKQLIAKAEMEKYSPFSASESLNEILSETKSILSVFEN